MARRYVVYEFVPEYGSYSSGLIKVLLQFTLYQRSFETLQMHCNRPIKLNKNEAK